MIDRTIKTSIELTPEELAVDRGARRKLGPWHPADVKPVHVGVYEIDEADDDGRAFSYWDGEKWGYYAWENMSKHGGGAVNFAHQMAVIDGCYRDERLVSWRGLAEKSG